MIKLSKETFSSPLAIFFIYLLASGLAIFGFRFIYPGEAAPLGNLAVSWRLARFLLNYFQLFPALALSALVIPFGFKVRAQEKLNPFSPQFLDSLKMSIISAITGAVLYAVLYFLVLPLIQDYEANLRYQGQLYRQSREQAQEHAARGEWNEAAHFANICVSIWPDDPGFLRLKTEIDIHTEEERFSQWVGSGLKAEASESSSPLDATEALALAEKALLEGRYFDAHWLATLGGRISAKGSVEESTAARLAGMAWSGVNSMAPNENETRAYAVFRLKRSGHEALITGEWIRAYYIFRELLEMSPDDPDAIRYLSLSESELQNAAFFIDEMEMNAGRTLGNAVFSFPQGLARIVMRISSLSVSADTAYGMGLEIMASDRDGNLMWTINAPYAKILPLTLDSGPATAVLMHALDRRDKNISWEGEIEGVGQDSASGTQIALPVTWDNFLLLSKIHRGFSSLSPAELFRAAANLESSGYKPEVFQAELIQRFADTLLILPLGFLAIVIGWRYRALKRPRYMAVPMLGILPLVFNGAIHFCRGGINNLGIWTVVSMGFTGAAISFAVGIFILVVLSLIILAAQHG